MFSVKNFCTAGCNHVLIWLSAAVMMAASLSGAAAQQKLMVYGDSLVAGYGLDAGQGFPEQLQAALTAAGRDVKVLNAGVSGDTTAGGLARLDWALADRPDAVVLVLGGNDLLRGLNPEQTRTNLHAMLTRLRTQTVLRCCCAVCWHRSISALITGNSLTPSILNWPQSLTLICIRSFWTGLPLIRL